jgi:hypothetical protein
MGIFDVKEKLNNIRVKLYQNNLPKAEGRFIARNESGTPLEIEEVCAYMKNRGGFTGSYDDLIEHVKRFLDETMYQLCNGKAVNMRYFSIHSSVGGTFDSAHERHDHDKNPVTFRFRCRRAMRELARATGVIIIAVADAAGYISDFTDVSSQGINETVKRGGQFVISGHKIKVEGDDPSCGLYFESVPNKRRIKVEGQLAENSPSKIIGIVPRLAAHRQYKVVIISQFTGSGTLLKTPRVITSDFALEAA